MEKARTAKANFIDATEAPTDLWANFTFLDSEFGTISNIFKSETSFGAKELTTRRAAIRTRSRDEHFFDYTDDHSGAFAHGNCFGPRFGAYPWQFDSDLFT